jgi:hypothetical protein
MTIKNLGPHAIKIGDRTIAPSGDLARVATATAAVGSFDGVPLTVTTPGVVTGLPDAQDGVLLIASAMVRLAVPDRMDVASPGQLVRNDAGQVVGCSSLDINPIN